MANFLDKISGGLTDIADPLFNIATMGMYGLAKDARGIPSKEDKKKIKALQRQIAHVASGQNIPAFAREEFTPEELQRSQNEALMSLMPGLAEQMVEPQTLKPGDVRTGGMGDVIARGADKSVTRPAFLEIMDALGVSKEEQRRIAVERETKPLVSMSTTQETEEAKIKGRGRGERIVNIHSKADDAFVTKDNLARIAVGLTGGAFTDALAGGKAALTELASALGVVVPEGLMERAGNTREVQKAFDTMVIGQFKYAKGNLNKEENKLFKESISAFGQSMEANINALAMLSLASDKSILMSERVSDADSRGATSQEIVDVIRATKDEEVITPEIIKAEREKWAKQLGVQPAAVPQADNTAIIQEARDAIAQGADPAAVRARLQELGVQGGF